MFLRFCAVGTCPLSSASITRVLIYAGYKDTDETFVDFENEKAILYKEAFATQTPHSRNRDSALNLTPCHYEVCHNIQVSG